VLFERFKRTLTMTLDADWVYRRMIPALWQWVVRPLLLALQPYHKGLIEGLPRAAVKRFGAGGIAASKADQRRYRPWSVGTTVLLVTLLLAVFLALNLFGNLKF
jgi:multicomponent Na+:H+ antiporter subunit D